MKKLCMSLRLSAAMAIGMALSGCVPDGPALEQEFRDSGQICFSVKGKVINRYDPLLWQSVTGLNSCEFTVCDDNMSDFYILRCSGVPREEGETFKCDATWSTYSDIKRKKYLEFKVVKAARTSGVVWLWCSSAMIGAAVMTAE